MRNCLLILFVFVISCGKDESNEPVLNDREFINGADMSFLPMIEESNIHFYNQNGIEENALSILKSSGLNTVRIRLWHTPDSESSSFNEVKIFSERVKSKGLKVLLCVHYSDTWADPGHQAIPLAWQNSSYESVKDSLYNYTQKIVRQIKPDYIQIGNEINPGFLLPLGDRFQHKSQFLGLLSEGIRAVRENSPGTEIIIHYAGTQEALTFYNQLSHLDYDIIGLSYYPWWHGKDMNNLASVITQLNSLFKQDVIVVETAYPFTLGWNDWTNNIIGSQDQLMSQYPASANGQLNFLRDLKAKIKNAGALGICYWGAGYVAFDGDQSANGSPWENLALFDFDQKVLPAAEVFKD